MKQFTFRKAEHLCRKKEIDALFNQAHQSVRVFPVLAVFQQVERASGAPVQLLLSVSKRRFKRAVRRNRTKRLLREAYRRQKHLLQYTPAPGRGLNVAFVWLSDALMSQAQVDVAVAQVLERMSAALQPEGDTGSVAAVPDGQP